MFVEALSTKQVRMLLALGVTAMPGVQRLLLALFIEFRHGLQLLGQFTNDVSIVMLVTHFTAIGWASLILVRVPVASGIGQLRVVRSLLRYVYPSVILGVGAWPLLSCISTLVYGLPCRRLDGIPIDSPFFPLP
jgi:hypothetical protein